ncbi:GNAT family N-acetyltransferase [Croceivirga radicis]|uniref:GNAT family N-acetyltransferase n=1 Tax=Croceivirga radicis TaxID=1929488 RepID=A0A1V6LMV6_9FLAO|nr:GNAT family N-acetyltransferase [Croceivirga radicis]OQD41521.1 GNAT family N-acetyltransferase [Croceivirga radicis]
MENVILRDARLEDLKTLKEFEQEIIRAERPFDPTIRPDPISYYNLEAYIKSQDVKVVVAEKDGQLVASGYALIKKARHYLDHDTYAFLGFMYTVPEVRGQGINAKIVAVLTQWAKKQGLEEVRLTVYQDNTPAIKAYEKSGFKSHINEMRLRLEK